MMKRSSNIDKFVIDKIFDLDANPNKVRHVDFFLYFSTEMDAINVEVELINLQFDTHVSQISNNREWRCSASKKMIVTEERLVDIGNSLEKLARTNNGKYDGWGSEV